MKKINTLAEVMGACKDKETWELLQKMTGLTQLCIAEGFTLGVVKDEVSGVPGVVIKEIESGKVHDLAAMLTLVHRYIEIAGTVEEEKKEGE